MDEETTVVEAEPQPDAQATETAAGLGDELMNFGEDETSDNAPADDAGETPGEPPAPADPAVSEAETPAAPDFFAQVLPDDERLPKPWRGKATIRDVLENQRQLVTNFQKAREQANTLERKIETQNAILDSLRRAGIGQQPEPQYQDPDVTEVLRQYGIADPAKELFDNPIAVLEALRQSMRDEAVQLQQPALEAAQNVETAVARKEHAAAAQTAWIDGLGVLESNGTTVSPEEWSERSPEVIALVRQDYQRWLRSPELQAERPDPSRDPLAYAAAYLAVNRRWVAEQPVGTPQPQAVRQPKQPDVQNPPHATRSSAIASSSSAPKVTPRMESEIREWAAEWKMPVDEVRKIFLEVESEGR